MNMFLPVPSEQICLVHASMYIPWLNILFIQRSVGCKIQVFSSRALYENISLTKLIVANMGEWTSGV